PDVVELPSQAADMKKWKLFAIVTVLSLIADQVTKIWARHSLPVEPVNCQGKLDVVDALIQRKCIASPGTVIHNYWHWRRSMDRISCGVVTDFVLWHYKTKEWPVFNIADVVLVVGVGLMFIDIQKENKREKLTKKARQEKAKKAGLVKDLEKS